MNKNLLILGAGSHGKVVKELAEAMGAFDKIDFLDDHSKLAIGNLSDFKKLKTEYCYAFPAFGDSGIRTKWMEILNENCFTLPVLVHPSAFISPSASIYPGTVIEARAIINTNVVIEQNCIIDLGVIVDHDSHIGYGCHIDCGAIIKAHCVVMPNSKIESGQVVT